MGIPDWPMWIKRIQGAQETQRSIDALAVQKYFKVPKKWIYPLPDLPTGTAGLDHKHFILIVENVHLKSARSNEWMWLSPFVMTEERMRALYLILQQVGLYDSVYIDNVPFCSDGRQAFIDTEHFHWWPVPFDRLLKCFPKEMRYLWKEWITYGMK